MSDEEDLVAIWELLLSSKRHKIEFYHGTVSGRRLVRIDGHDIVRHDFMFKLVGHESFKVAGKYNCRINIKPVGSFTYEYTLDVDGKSYKKFTENRSKISKVWVLPVDGDMYRIVLEKDCFDIWVNGRKAETAGEFVDNGSETHFAVGRAPAFIRTTSSGNKRIGLLHALFVEDNEIPEFKDEGF